MQVTDGREKVWRHGDVLVGEVTEISAKLERRRRIYLVPGAHLIVDVAGEEAKITGAGKSGVRGFRKPVHAETGRTKEWAAPRER